MNQTNNQPNSNEMESTFSPTQSDPQTNPFTEGLKGEFTSNFGTNTNAVSQIFKDGNFSGQSRGKYILAGVAVLVIVVALFLIMTEPEEPSLVDTELNEIGEPATQEPEAGEAQDPEMASTETVADESPAQGGEAMVEEDPAAMAQQQPTDYTGDYSGTAAPANDYMGSGPITLASPANGQSWTYDETMGPATFEWQGGGGVIIFSRSSSMKPEVMRVPVSGSGYSFHNPYPGTWYWQVVNNSGPSEVRSFNVDAPVRRNIVVNQVADLAGNGGVVEWQGDEKVAFYRVELSTGGWANPNYRFATSGTRVEVNGVAPGQYQMRVGAFSEVSGRWEYTAPAPLNVQ